MELCSIASGSSGNCIFVGTDNSSVLVDVGITNKRAVEGLHSIGRKPEELDAVLITHEHSDHIRGLGVFARKYHIPVYASPGTIRAMMDGNLLGKVDPDLFHEIRPDEMIRISDFEVKPFRVSHDAAEPVAYRLEAGGKAAAIATDMGCYDTYTVNHLMGLDLALIESNHDINMLQVGTYPYYLKRRILGDHGHLCNESAGRLISEILHDGLKHIFLGHLSKENNYEALAYATVCSEITMGDCPYRGDDFNIEIAKRDMPSELVHA